MHSSQPGPPARRTRALLTIIGAPQLHLRSPMIVALWSAIFPGFGHFLLSRYLTGMILFLWEIIINFSSHLNVAIFYTFTGSFDMAKSVLDKDWLLLYIPTYLFTIWDSYRTTVDLNHQFLLAAREDSPVKPFIKTPLGFNYLDKSSPWPSAVWSILSPGAGQLMAQRTLVAFFIMAWWIVVAYSSKVLPAIHYTALLQFDRAKEAVNIQWLLNIPSMVFFGIYDAYVNIVEKNKLFEWEQAKYLKGTYQSKAFLMPFPRRDRGKHMYVVSNFEHSIKLELAVTALAMQGISKEDILAVPLDKRNEEWMLIDRIHASDQMSTMDVPMIFAATFALFGLIYGFLWTWGPILWSLIGTGLGFGIGLLVKFLFSRKYKGKKRTTPAEVVLLVSCRDTQLDLVKDILWKHDALGVSKLSLDEDAQGRKA